MNAVVIPLDRQGAPNEAVTPVGPQHVVQLRSAQCNGRVRVTVAALHRRPEVCGSIAERLVRDAVVTQARANPLTGSLTIHWQPRLASQDEILALVQEALRDVPASRTRNAVASGIVPKLRTALLPLRPRGAATAASPSQSRPQVTAPVAAAVAAADEGRAWHAIPMATLLQELATAPEQGLSHASALERLGRFGSNTLTEAAQRSDLAIFLEQFRSLPVALLGVSAVVALATGGLVDAAVIGAVVLFNGALGFVTERQAERTIRSLGHYGPHSASVIREGEVMQRPVDDLVPGDVLLLGPGVAVPADARIVASHRLTIDESALTGESLPTAKQADVLALNQPLADRSNMAYKGTHVTGGSGRAVVVETGMRSELGRIQALLGSAQSPDTPLQQQLDSLGRQLAIASGAICVGVFAIGVWRGYGLLPMLKAAISLAVAAVPEGLPTVATTTLALGIRKMRNQNALMRQLPAVETLGSVQTLCFDKTGTLTLNRMTALAVATASAHYSRRGSELIDAEGVSISAMDEPLIQRLLIVATLCNDTQVQQGPEGTVLDGSATENALVDLALASGLEVAPLREAWPRLQTQYRAENRNYMATLHRANGPMQRYVAVKGSPTELLELCSSCIVDGVAVPLDAAQRERLRGVNDVLADQALRVLAFADGWTDDEGEDFDASGLTWLGLIGMADPTREGISELMRKFHDAGIATVMITGDQSATAYAIAKQLNLNNGHPVEIFDSAKLDTLEPEMLTALAPHVQVFARVSPAHKLQIVRALQKSGRVVAMTGDGVNDSPALKAADIGIAMGNSGTDVARSVADVVLADDNLGTMATAVEQGRTIYSNIRKALRFLLSTNLSEIEVMLATTALGLGEPLTPLQLLWINLLSDIFPGLALAVEPAEPEVMKRPPRDPRRPILDGRDLRRTLFEATTISGGTLAAYVYGLRRYGMGPQASTLSFMTLVVAQLVQAYSCRSETHRFIDRPHLQRNPYLNMAVGGSLALQLVAPYAPPLRKLLGLAPLGPVDAAVVAVAAVLPYLINELTKSGIARPPPSQANTEPSP
jgi:Ca2+-transporting ATPase